MKNEIDAFVALKIKLNEAQKNLNNAFMPEFCKCLDDGKINEAKALFDMLPECWVRMRAAGMLENAGQKKTD